jgi:hypothetical protein
LSSHVGTVPDATNQLFVAFTAARFACKTATVEFNESAHRPNRQGNGTVAALQAWISQNPTNLDVVAPIKARACDALQAMLRSRPPRQKAPNSRIMARGVERC